MPAVVMFKRSVFEYVGGFSTSPSVKGSEDYDLYLRITKDFSVCCHSTEVAEYRQHSSSMSRNSELMLKTSLAVLRSQTKHVKGSKQYEEALKIGVRTAQDFYGGQLAHKAQAHMREREWKQAIRDMLVLLRYFPRILVYAWRKLRLPFV